MRKTLPFLTSLLLLTACENVRLEQPVEMNVPPKQAHQPEVQTIDVEHYALDLNVDPIARGIDGRMTVRFVSNMDGLPRVTFDLAELKVYNVVDKTGTELASFQKGHEVTIVLTRALARGESEELTIAYAGQPKKGIWFTDVEGGVATQVFTQGECEDSQWWFPCIDDPADRATSELRVTMPKHWTSVAAGERVERTENGNFATEHWRMSTPHPVYLTTLVAGDFVVQNGEWEGVPLMYLADPEYASMLEASFAATGPALSFMSDVTGLRYPYPKYSQACVDDFPFGGMENISASTMTDRMLRDAKGLRDSDATGLIVHEAAHQWFGDLLTCKTWDHIWLNEGFATYMTLLFYEDRDGDDEFRMRWYDTLQGYLASDTGKDRRPTVHAVWRDPIDLFFTGQTYAGGAARLHYLRFLLGDEAFFDGVETYVADNMGRGVVTNDFRLAMEKASGQNLAGFFEQWLYGEGYPELDVRWTYNAEKRQVRLTVEQKQAELGGTPGAFRLPVDVAVRTTRGTVLHRLDITERKASFTLASDMEPSWVWFDEGGWLPARIERHKSPKEWLTLAAQGPDALQRRLAVDALGNGFRGEGFVFREEQVDFARAELVNRLRQDPNSWVRKSAASALGKDKSDEARLRLMAAASSDVNTHVRAAAFDALGGWGKDLELAGFARQQYEEGFSYRTQAAAARLIAKSDPDGIFQWLVRELFEADSPHDVLRRDLINTLAGLDHSRVPSQLIQWATDPTADAGARVAAINGLGRLTNLDKEARSVLLDMLAAEEFGLRRAAVTSLAKYDDAISRTALQAYYKKTVFPRDKRTIEAVFNY